VTTPAARLAEVYDPEEIVRPPAPSAVVMGGLTSILTTEGLQGVMSTPNLVVINRPISPLCAFALACGRYTPAAAPWRLTALETFESLRLTGRAGLLGGAQFVPLSEGPEAAALHPFFAAIRHGMARAGWESLDTGDARGQGISVPVVRSGLTNHTAR
jgi:hypothetical protein